MITSLRMVNFKNFADETLRVGPFTVIIGANASGKSNIRDAFRFLHGIGRGYTLAEILGGKIGVGGQLEWSGIRGAPREVGRLDSEFSIPDSTFSIEVEAEKQPQEKLSYSIDVWFNAFGPDGFRVAKEELKTPSRRIFKAHPGSNSRLNLSGSKRDGFDFSPSHNQPVLSQLHRIYGNAYPDFASDLSILQIIQKIRFLDPSPQRMREPSFPGARLGDGGENLPSVLESICADSTRGGNLMSWLQELTPMDVKDFDFPRDPSGRVHLHIVERNGRKVSAYSTSDGTLRFLGILAALLGTNEGGLYFFEEIDNGIHPNRLWLLLELIEQQTTEGKLQVVTTTHSPALLAWMSEKAFEHTSVVYRDEYWADSVIRPISGLYNLRELRESQGLERLLTSGWFENAMKFSEGDSDSDHLDDDEGHWVEGVLQ